MCMYVCVRMFVRMFVYMCMDLCFFVRMHVCMYVCMYVHMSTSGSKRVNKHTVPVQCPYYIRIHACRHCTPPSLQAPMHTGTMTHVNLPRFSVVCARAALLTQPKQPSRLLSHLRSLRWTSQSSKTLFFIGLFERESVCIYIYNMCIYIIVYNVYIYIYIYIILCTCIHAFMNASVYVRRCGDVSYVHTHTYTCMYVYTYALVYTVQTYMHAHT